MLGVASVDRSKTFYERLGWRGQLVEGTVFFEAGGLALVLWGHKELADDAGVLDAHAQGFRGVSLAHDVRSAAEVDEVIRLTDCARATVTRRPAETIYGGYAGYFADPDGHAWEIAHNPGFPMAEDGSITVPDFG